MPWNPLTTPVGWPVAASLQGLAVRWVGRVGGQSERFDGRLVEDHATVEVLHPDRIVRRRGGELLRCGQPPFGKLTDVPAADDLYPAAGRGRSDGVLDGLDRTGRRRPQYPLPPGLVRIGVIPQGFVPRAS